MTFSPRAFVLLVALIAAACSPVINPSERPHSPSTPTGGPATAVADASAPDGEWFCYNYQPGVGTNAINTSGIAGANSLLGSFHIETASTYAAFFGTDKGTYSFDPATNGISFDSGSMKGLEGTYGAGPKRDLIDLHGVSDGWDSPFKVYLICQHA